MDYSSPNIYTNDANIKMPRYEASHVSIVHSDQTRKYSRNLLFCLVVMVAITLLGFEPKNLALLGVALDRGNVSLECAVLLLAIFFAAWGAVPWWNDLHTYQARFRKMEGDFKRAISGILDKAVIAPDDRKSFPKGIAVDQAKLTAAIDRRLADIEKSPSGAGVKEDKRRECLAITDGLPNEIIELEKLRSTRKRVFHISQWQHYWFFAAIVPLCGALVLWSFLTSGPPELTTWCYGTGSGLYEYSATKWAPPPH